MCVSLWYLKGTCNMGVVRPWNIYYAHSLWLKYTFKLMSITLRTCKVNLGYIPVKLTQIRVICSKFLKYNVDIKINMFDYKSLSMIWNCYKQKRHILCEIIISFYLRLHFQFVINVLLYNICNIITSNIFLETGSV